MSRTEKQEHDISAEDIKKMLREMIYHIDPKELFDDMKKSGIPIPTFDEIEETEHEFSPEFNEKIAQLFKDIGHEPKQNENGN